MAAMNYAAKHWQEWSSVVQLTSLMDPYLSCHQLSLHATIGILYSS